MMRRILLVLIALFVIPTTLAQGAPEQIQDALALLNQRLGANLTTNDLYWSWAQESYNDTSLGCPTEGEMYAQVVTVGYRFEFRYQGQIYDIRVSADRSTTRLCSVIAEADVVTPTPDPEQLQERSNVLCPEAPAGIVYMKTRLAPDMQAVVEGGLPSNLRDAPADTAAILTEIPAGGEFTVVAGPFCDDKGLLWWQVNYAQSSGYIAEGSGGAYFVGPKPPLNLQPADQLQVIAPETINALEEKALAYGAYSGGLAIADDGTIAVTGNAGSEGVWLYRIDAFSQTPRILESRVRMTHAAFSSGEGVENVVLLGADDGTIRLWSVSPTAQVIERAQLNSQREAVRAIAFSPDGARIVAAGGLALTSANSLELDSNAIVIWAVNSVSQALVLRGHTDEVNALAYHPDSTRIVSASEDGTARVWDASTGELLETYTHHADDTVAVTSAVYSADGAWLALGFADGVVNMIPSDGSAVVVAQEGGVPVTTLAFSPSGLVLVTGSDDGSLVLWDMTKVQGDAPRREIYSITQSAVQSIAFSADGTLLFAVSEDNTLRAFGVSQG